MYTCTVYDKFLKYANFKAAMKHCNCVFKDHQPFKFLQFHGCSLPSIATHSMAKGITYFEQHSIKKSTIGWLASWLTLNSCHSISFL